MGAVGAGSCRASGWWRQGVGRRRPQNDGAQGTLHLHRRRPDPVSGGASIRGHLGGVAGTVELDDGGARPGAPRSGVKVLHLERCLEVVGQSEHPAGAVLGVETAGGGRGCGGSSSAAGGERDQMGAHRISGSGTKGHLEGCAETARVASVPALRSVLDLAPVTALLTTWLRTRRSRYRWWAAGPPNGSCCARNLVGPARGPARWRW